ncbi:MAG: hypothetical protein AB1689_15525, partial [Thermodesulfobacteriota bacterium]
MSVAAIGAQVLDRCLREARAQRGALPGSGLDFQRRLARVVDVPWELSTLEDLRYREVEAPRSLRVRALHAYTGAIHVAAAYDREVARRFLRVVHLLDAPSALLRPSVALRLLLPAPQRWAGEPRGLLGGAA